MMWRMFEMTKMYLKGLVKDEKGQGMVEYGLILALVAIVVVGVLGTMGDQLLATFTKVSNKLPAVGE